MILISWIENWGSCRLSEQSRSPRSQVADPDLGGGIVGLPRPSASRSPGPPPETPLTEEAQFTTIGCAHSSENQPSHTASCNNIRINMDPIQKKGK